jgi:hypothetical protein
MNSNEMLEVMLIVWRICGILLAIMVTSVALITFVEFIHNIYTRYRG